MIAPTRQPAFSFQVEDYVATISFVDGKPYRVRVSQTKQASTDMDVLLGDVSNKLTRAVRAKAKRDAT